MSAGVEANQASGRWARVACVSALLLACLCGAARKLGDFDLPWHLALGREIVLRRSIPNADDLSYTFRGAALRCEPLADAALFLTERLGGPLALQLLAALALLALSFAMVARGSLGVGRRAWPLAIALTALGLMTAGSWLVLRPALLSFPLLAIALWLIDAHRQRGAGRGLLWLLPLQLTWANVHGAAPLGAAVAIGYGLYALACRLARGRLGWLLPRNNGDGLGVALLAGAGAALATCCSPSGLAIFGEPFRVWRYGEWVTEWTPTTLVFVEKHDPALLAAGAVVALALLASALRGPPRFSLFDLGLALGGAVLAGSRVRLIPLFAIAALPLAARLVFPLLARARTLHLAALLLTLAAAPALLASPGVRPGVGWDRENLPLGAAEFAALHRPTGALWNFLPFGGWIAWRLHPDVSVFIDGRTAKLYPDAFLAEYRKAGSDSAAFAALQKRWDLSWAMVRARRGELFDAPLAADANWTMVYLDDSAALYVRNDGPDRALARDGYRLLRHLMSPPALFLAFADRSRPPPAAQLDALAHDAALAASQQPDSARANFFLATVALARGDLRLAGELARLLLVLDPDFEGTWLIEDELRRRADHPPGARPNRER